MKATRIATSTDPGFEHPLVDPEFLDYLPLRKGRDEAELTALLLENGCREPVIVWDEPNIVVDGHRRSSICAAHGIPYRVHYMAFADREAVKEWMRRNQLYGKRNLTDIERSYLIGKEYQAEPEPAKKAKGDKAAKVAKKNKVSRRKVQLDDKFAKAVDAHEAVAPGTKKKILTGGVSRTQVLKTAPVLCDRCIRVGAVKDCPRCEEVREKKPKKAAPKSLLDVIPKPKPGKAPPEPVDPIEELKSLTTKLARLFTQYMVAEGETAARLCEYFGWCGLLDYGPKGGEPKFIPLEGVRKLLTLAEKRGPTMPKDEVLEAYKTACGAVPWVPPATKYRRERKAKR